MNLFEKIFSIEEFKVSALVVTLFAAITFGAYEYATHGDITSNWTGIIESLIYTIGGVNIARSAVSFVSAYKQSSTQADVKYDHSDTEAEVKGKI